MTWSRIFRDEPCAEKPVAWALVKYADESEMEGEFCMYHLRVTFDYLADLTMAADWPLYVAVRKIKRPHSQPGFEDLPETAS